MSAKPLDGYFDRLKQAAQAANMAEDSYRREALQRVKELEEERAFAFRRLNLMQDIAASIASAKDEAEAITRGSSTLLRELGWNGATKAQRDVVERFRPVIIAVRQTDQADDGTNIPIEGELAAFESWYAENRNSPFLKLMEHEVVELPLVEV